jgi:nucleoside-diphosphate-sugar epimerase
MHRISPQNHPTVMKIRSVLLTGITGYIGGTIAVKLKERGDEVVGLVRRESDEAKIQAAGFATVRGDLRDKAVVREAVKRCDAVVHTADSDDPEIAQTFLEALQGTGKTFIYTSGSAIVANWADPKTAEFVYTEDFPLEDRPPFPTRVSINNAVLRAAAGGVRSVVVVPGLVYGKGLLLAPESKQVPLMIAYAKKTGRAAYIGDGEHRWSNVHVEDLAELYLAALDRAKPGSIFFAESGDASFKEVAVAIQQSLALDGEPVSLSRDEAIAAWGELMATVALGSNCRLNADKARQFLNWRPTRGPVTKYI